MKGKGKLSRKIAWTTICFVLAIGLSGCRHKPQLAPLPPVLTPVALEDIPEPQNLPVVEAPSEKLPPVPVSTEAGKPKRRKKQPPKVIVPPEPPPETQIASAAGGAVLRHSGRCVDGRWRNESADEAGGGGPYRFDRQEAECIVGAKSGGGESSGKQGKELLEGCARRAEIWRR